jgi:hypothetical protein
MPKQEVVQVWLNAAAKGRAEGDVRWAVYCEEQAERCK